MQTPYISAVKSVTLAAVVTPGLFDDIEQKVLSHACTAKYSSMFFFFFKGIGRYSLSCV